MVPVAASSTSTAENAESSVFRSRYLVLPFVVMRSSASGSCGVLAMPEVYSPPALGTSESTDTRSAYCSSRTLRACLPSTLEASPSALITALASSSPV
ncbi:hypothetical protein SSPIM334S_07662 [Streptomyces spiroverticillatus]